MTVLLAAAASASGATDSSFWDNRFFLNGINGTVNAIAVSGTNLYAGGSFTSADGVAATNIAHWNGTRWSSLGGGVNGQVNAIAVRGHEVYVGGTFTNVGPISANRVAKWDGTNWSALGSGISNNAVNALAVSGSGVLYAAGDFTSAGGVNTTNIAQWDGTHWSALGNGVSDVYQAYASALAVMGNDLFVGGYFTEAGRVNADNLAQWNGTNWSAVGGGVDDPTYPAQVTALAVSGNALYVGGSFSSAGTITASNIARWDGTNWSALGAGLGRFYGDLPVTTLTVSSNQLLVGGRFVSAGAVSVTNLARWDGATWNGMGGGAAGTVKALALCEPPNSQPSTLNSLYVGGSFSVTNGAIPVALAKWSGAEWLAVSAGGGEGLAGSGDQVAALAMSDSGIFAGGAFTFASGVQASNLALWDGTHWSSVGGGVNGPVYALVNSTLSAQPPALNPLYAAGKFTVAGGVTASNIARWDGANWTPLGSGLNGTVYALALNSQPSPPNLLYAGGAFTNAGGVSASNVACWNGVTWSALGSGVNGLVYALALSGSNLYVGGKFTVAGGISASNVARWDGRTWSALGNGAGGVVSPFPRVRPPPVSVLLVHGNDLYVGGDFTWAGEVAATNIARWDGTNWSALGPGVLGVPSFSPPPTVRALAIHSTLNSPLSALNPLLVGGTFIKAGNLPMSNVARWDGSQWSPMGEGINSPPPVAALALKPGEVYLGGSFKFASGKPASDFTIWYSAVRLKIARAGTAVVISWPAAADGYALQTTATFSPVSWQAVTNQPVRLGNQWSVAITNPGPSQFYRLQKP